jgi:hypothetical protein
MTRIALTRIVLVVFILVSTIFGVACEKRPDPCDTLTARICEGRDRGYCLRARAFLDRELTGPGGLVLTGRSRSEGCRLILADHQVLGAYAREVARSIK